MLCILEHSKDSTDMDRKQKTRYLWAIYWLILLVAVILDLLGFTQGKILLSLSTELREVFVVFALVNYFLIGDDWNLSKRVHKLLNKLELSEHPSAMLFFQKPPDIKARVQAGSQVNFCGVTLTSTIGKQLSALREQLRAGCPVRIMIIN